MKLAKNSKERNDQLKIIVEKLKEHFTSLRLEGSNHTVVDVDKLPKIETEDEVMKSF